MMTDPVAFLELAPRHEAPEELSMQRVVAELQLTLATRRAARLAAVQCEQETERRAA